MRKVFFGLFAALIAQATTAFAGSPELPSEGLEDRIEFWKKVYTQYGEDDVIIHDRFRVNLIYDIAVRGEHRAKVDVVEDALDEVRTNLETPENLGNSSIRPLG